MCLHGKQCKSKGISCCASRNSILHWAQRILTQKSRRQLGSVKQQLAVFVFPIPAGVRNNESACVPVTTWSLFLSCIAPLAKRIRLVKKLNASAPVQHNHNRVKGQTPFSCSFISRGATTSERAEQSHQRGHISYYFLVSSGGLPTVHTNAFTQWAAQSEN